MILRAERNRGGGVECGGSSSGGKLYVFRLSELEEHLLELMEWHHSVDMLLHNEAGGLQVRLRRGLFEKDDRVAEME